MRVRIRRQVRRRVSRAQQLARWAAPVARSTATPPRISHLKEVGRAQPMRVFELEPARSLGATHNSLVWLGWRHQSIVVVAVGLKPLWARCVRRVLLTVQEVTEAEGAGVRAGRSCERLGHATHSKASSLTPVLLPLT